MMHVYWMETRTELLKFARMKSYAAIDDTVPADVLLLLRAGHGAARSRPPRWRAT